MPIGLVREAQGVTGEAALTMAHMAMVVTVAIRATAAGFLVKACWY